VPAARIPARFHDDPRSAVLIAGYLRNREGAYVDALGIRIREMLRGFETLALDEATVADRLARAVRNNVATAQRDDRQAIQAGTTAVLSRLDTLPAEVAELAEGIAAATVEHLEAGRRERRPVLVLAVGLREDDQRHLDQLAATDNEAAARLAQHLSRGGVEAVEALARYPEAWTEAMPAAFWRATGSILLGTARLDAARVAFEREADHPDVDDRAVALVAAARAADAAGDVTARDDLMARARGVHDDHPSVLLLQASLQTNATERLRLADAAQPLTKTQLSWKEAERALALLGLGEDEAAAKAAAASIAADDTSRSREAMSVATIVGAVDRLPARAADERPLAAAIAFQEELATHAATRPFAGLAWARAALGQAVLGDHTAVRRAVEAALALEDGLALDEARAGLREAAMLIGDGDLLGRLGRGPDGDPQAPIVALMAKILVGGDTRAAAVTEIDELLETAEPGSIRAQLIGLRMDASTDPAIELRESLAGELPDGERVLALTRAIRASALGDYSAARNALSGLDDLASLAARSQIAEDAGSLAEAIAHQATLARRARTGPNFLRLAYLRSRIGD